MSAPTNGTCATAIDVTGLTPYSLSIDTTLASTDTEVTPTCGGANGHKAVWWSYVNTSTSYELVEVTTDGSYYTNVSAWAGTCGSLVQVSCQNSNYASHKTYATFAAAPSTMYLIFITDNDFGVGGVMTVNIDAVSLADGGYLITGGSGATNQALAQAYAEGDGSLVSADVSGAGNLALRLTDNHILAFSGNLYDLAPSLGLLATTTITSPGAPWNAPMWMGFAPTGALYLLWDGTGGSLDVHFLRRVDPVTFATIDEWSDWSVMLGSGASLQPGTFSPDGSIFYYAFFGGTANNQNRIYAFDLNTQIETVFATYGAWSGGVGATGSAFRARSMMTFANGNLAFVETHQTAGTIDNQAILIYSPAGTLLHTYPLTPTGNILIGGAVLTPDETAIWTVSNFPFLDEYLVSDGTRASHFSIANNGNSLLYLPVTTPTPPFVPPDPTTFDIVRMRQTPHVWDGDLSHWIRYPGFELLFEAGGPRATSGQMKVALQVSRDGGHTWGPIRWIDASAIGQYRYRARWMKLGRARDLMIRVIESNAAKVVWIDGILTPEPQEGTN